MADDRSGFRRHTWRLEMADAAAKAATRAGTRAQDECKDVCPTVAPERADLDQTEARATGRLEKFCTGPPKHLSHPPSVLCGGMAQEDGAPHRCSLAQAVQHPSFHGGVKWLTRQRRTWSREMADAAAAAAMSAQRSENECPAVAPERADLDQTEGDRRRVPGSVKTDTEPAGKRPRLRSPGRRTLRAPPTTAPEQADLNQTAASNTPPRPHPPPPRAPTDVKESEEAEDTRCPCGGGQSCIVERRCRGDWVHEDDVLLAAGLHVRTHCFSEPTLEQKAAIRARMTEEGPFFFAEGP